MPLQPEGVLGFRVTAFSDTEHRHLLELLKLGVGKAPDGESIEVVHKHPANIRRQAVVGDNVDQQPAVGQGREGFDQKPLLMPGFPAALVEDGQIRRVQEHQVERLAADPAVEEAAETHPMQSRLGFFRPAFVQLHPVGVAVVSLGNLPQGFTAPAAGVQEIRGDALRELDSLKHQGDVVRVRGVVAQLDVVHQPSDDGGIGGSLYRKALREGVERIVDRPVIAAHEIEAQQAVPEFSGSDSGLVFLRLHQKQTGLSQGLRQTIADTQQNVKGILSGGAVRGPVLLHPGPPNHKGLGQV